MSKEVPLGTRIIVSTNAATTPGGLGTPKTLLQYQAPSGIAARVLRYGISFDGTSSTDPRALVDLQLGATNDGSGSADISSEIAVISGQGTTLGTARQAPTTEPSTGVGTRNIRPHQVPVTSPFEAALGAGIDLAPGQRIGIRASNAAARNARAFMEIELG